ncbi:unnamed protein product [Chrysoparadoxa australica]
MDVEEDYPPDIPSNDLLQRLEASFYRAVDEQRDMDRAAEHERSQRMLFLIHEVVRQRGMLDGKDIWQGEPPLLVRPPDRLTRATYKCLQQVERIASIKAQKTSLDVLLDLLWQLPRRLVRGPGDEVRVIVHEELEMGVFERNEVTDADLRRQALQWGEREKQEDDRRRAEDSRQAIHLAAYAYAVKARELEERKGKKAVTDMLEGDERQMAAGEVVMDEGELLLEHIELVLRCLVWGSKDSFRQAGDLLLGESAEKLRLLELRVLRKVFAELESFQDLMGTLEEDTGENDMYYGAVTILSVTGYTGHAGAITIFGQRLPTLTGLAIRLSAAFIILVQVFVPVNLVLGVMIHEQLQFCPELSASLNTVRSILPQSPVAAPCSHYPGILQALTLSLAKHSTLTITCSGRCPCPSVLQDFVVNILVLEDVAVERFLMVLVALLYSAKIFMRFVATAAFTGSDVVLPGPARRIYRAYLRSSLRTYGKFDKLLNVYWELSIYFLNLFIILQTEALLEMVLNMLALEFVMTLDNEYVVLCNAVYRDAIRRQIWQTGLYRPQGSAVTCNCGAAFDRLVQGGQQTLLIFALLWVLVELFGGTCATSSACCTHWPAFKSNSAFFYWCHSHWQLLNACAMARQGCWPSHHRCG